MGVATSERPTSATVQQTDALLDASDRRLERAFRVASYVLLAVSTLLATIADVVGHRSAAYRLGTVAVAAVAAGWMLWWVTLHRPGPGGAG